MEVLLVYLVVRHSTALHKWWEVWLYGIRTFQFQICGFKEQSVPGPRDAMQDLRTGYD